MGQFSNSFPKHFSYLCEYAIRFDLSCNFCEYPFIFHCLHCSPSCFDPDSLLLAYLWLGLSWIDCISANKSFSSSKTSSRKPYTSSKQQERHKHSVESTINFSRRVACTRGVLEPDPGRGLTPNLDREGEGDVRHCLCAQEVVWPHRITTVGGLHGPSVLTELAQGARRHPLGTGGKEGPVAQDVRQVRPQRRICPGKGQHCGGLPQSMGLPRGQGMD